MKIFFTTIVFFLLLITTAEAAKIDAYRDMLSSGRFNLMYTIVNPQVHITNREATLKGKGFFGSFKMTESNSTRMPNLFDYMKTIGIKIDTLNKYTNFQLITALSPIISPDKIIATYFTPEYKFIGSGTLDDGLNYEDFFGSKNGFNCAIRYYFNGDTLVKIAVFDYLMDDSQVQAYEKYLIQIDEFSPTNEQNHFTLPS